MSISDFFGIDDLLAKSKLGKAYYVPVPLNYLLATGAMIAQWGYFEMQFMGFIRYLARGPDLWQMGRCDPGSFDGKAKLLRQIARLAFPNCESLVNKICDFSTRSNMTCKQRNIFVHGLWFDMTPFEPEKGVTIMTKPDGTGDFYLVSLPEIEKLAGKIESLKIEGVRLMFAATHGPSERLTDDELSALREHHDRAPDPNQESPPVRDPNRKGSPQQPEPFRA